MEKKIIAQDSQEAASYKTVTGWVSRDGIFWGNDERMARWSGCTHVSCKGCGASIEKRYVNCESCIAKIDDAKFAAMPTMEWDGEALLYSEANDKYYSTIEDAEDELEEGETLAALKLIICTPNYVSALDEEYCCDDLTEEGELPHVVEQAMEDFNKAVKGVVISWSPGNFALKV